MDPVRIVLDCEPRWRPRARYVFDSLLLAAGLPVEYVDDASRDGVILHYTAAPGPTRPGTVVLHHDPGAWAAFERDAAACRLGYVQGVPVVLASDVVANRKREPDVAFDLPANAFYFLSSWPERSTGESQPVRASLAGSVYARLGVPQDVVDRYLERLLACVRRAAVAVRATLRPRPAWPGAASHVVVLTHDVDFLPVRPLVDTLLQGAKSVLRHAVRQRAPRDGVRALCGLLRALRRGEDPYGCVPQIVARERALGVRSSFQIAVARRHPRDVNYSVEDPRIRDYLRVICDAGFDLCLHGSYRSTERPGWYEEEARLLARTLQVPRGSRQHFLSFGYDALFAAQERAGIEYDMSMGYADHPGPRAGFSFPYFPYCFERERAYDVVEISLFLMDVTLQSYLRLDARRAWDAIVRCLRRVAARGGAVSAVWHPIVFGDARDPGYADLYWRLVEHVRASGGLATDGRTVNALWRERARRYPSFAHVAAGS